MRLAPGNVNSWGLNLLHEHRPPALEMLGAVEAMINSVKNGRTKK